MKLRLFLSGIYLICLGSLCNAQAPQGFFLNDWKQKNISSPQYNDVQQTSLNVTVSITVDLQDTITKIPGYLFGDNANLWTGCMSNNPGLMKHLADRNMGVLRGPGGSISDVFFWNSNIDHRPSDIPSSLVGSTATDWPWYGDRPSPYDTWTMDTDSLYSILKQVNATGMKTVNYGYARYGTSANPVAQAAHMASDWVRYDKGRSKFWEIGNEVFGSWEAGYHIDLAQNKDGQPEYITPTLYGQHCLVFIDSMKAAAQKIGVDIKIGVVMVEASSTSASWNKAVATQTGDKADFYIVHSYFTPYNQNSDISTILNSYAYTGSYKNYVWSEADQAGKPHLPVALTEYNIFAVGSNQPVSQINGMHAVLVTGEAMKTGFGAADRWDLANGYDNGNDQGMYAYNETGIPNYTPHPAFYYLYYLQKYTGDVLLNSTVTGSPDVVIIPTAFHSGQVGAAIINTSKMQKIVRLNIRNFKFGDRYYTFTLKGTPGEDFSRKVYVNDIGNSLAAGGPDNYATIKANSSLIDNEIKINVPALAVTYVLVEPGAKELVINNEVSVRETPFTDRISIFPNPSDGTFTLNNIPAGISSIEITDIYGRSLFKKVRSITDPDENIETNLNPGFYLLTFKEDRLGITRKLIIR